MAKDNQKKLLAFDLGAESGRGVLGFFDGQRVRLEVVHRFSNGPVRTLDTLHWDVLRLHSEMLAALRRCAADYGGIDGLGVDAQSFHGRTAANPCAVRSIGDPFE